MTLTDNVRDLLDSPKVFAMLVHVERASRT
ncbi:MAG: hypothetical protein QOE98_439 [Gaiellaceae bacterium]|nr:hypothetical protein [Gaiellaceae bacterium]